MTELSDERIDQIFGSTLSKLRLGRGFDLLEFAFQSKISLNRIYELESGTARKGVTQKECIRIAIALNEDPVVLCRIAAGISVN